MNQERKRGTRRRKIKKRPPLPKKKSEHNANRKARHSKHTYAHTKQLQESDTTQDTLKQHDEQQQQQQEKSHKKMKEIIRKKLTSVIGAGASVFGWGPPGFPTG